MTDRKFTRGSRRRRSSSHAHRYKLLPRQSGSGRSLRRNILRSTKHVHILITILDSWKSKYACIVTIYTVTVDVIILHSEP